MDILKEFGVDPILLAAQVVNFLILLFILKRFLYGPILKVLEKRKETITQSLKNAEEIEKKLTQAGEEAEKILAKTLQESQKILDETNQTAAQILVDVNKAGEQILKKAVDDSKKVVELEKVQLMSQVKGSLSDIVLLALQKVLDSKVTKEQREIIERVLKKG